MSLYSSEIEIKIPFYDLDPMNIVWHGNYIKYLEQARCKLFAELNYTYVDMKDDFYAYPIAKMDVKYIKPAFFEQEIVIKTFLQEIEPAIKIKYEIYDKQTKTKIFKANTLQIAVDTRTLKSIYTPPKRLIEALEGKNE